MKGKWLLAIVLILALSLAFSSLALAQDEEEVLFKVDVRNNTDQLVTLQLVDGLTTYILNVPAGASQVFTVREGTYSHTTFACGESATGTLALTSQVRLVFTPCFGEAVNAGEPSIEKIQLPDVPEGANWKYQLFD
jgi:hypothetical protein